MIKNIVLLSTSFFLWSIPIHVSGTDYYFHPELGNDANSNTNILSPLKSLAKASTIDLQEGDAALLAAGYTFKGMLKI
jgi:hypothetical protein